MGRKKKNKNADFQKVKIKAGKRKPKSLNEERPEFSVKKIKLNPLPETSQNSKEMVKLLTNGNMNTSSKISYLDKLNKVLATELNDGSDQAGEQIQALCKFLRDRDKKCRQKAIECLKCCISIISHNGDEAMNPVMSILFTHLNTGFTDFDNSVKEDCKKFFEYLLKRADNSLNSQIMQIFITRIEKYTGKNSKQIMDYQTYNLLHMFIKKRPDFFKLTNKASDKNKDDKHGSEKAEESYIIEPSDYILAIPLISPTILAKRYENLQDFSLTEALNPTMNLKDKFLKITQEMVEKDVKVLACKRSERESQLDEEKRLALANGIAKLLC